MMGSDAEGRSAAAIKKRVQRDRKAFNEWQKLQGYRLVECEPGGKKDEKYFKTRYRLHLLAAAAGALEAARNNRTWQRNPAKALSRAAEIALMTLEGGFTKRERFNRPRQDDEALLSRYRKTILTLASKARGLIERNGGDPTEYLEKLARDIPAMSTSELSEERVEFVHKKGDHDNGQSRGAWAGASPMDKSVPPLGQQNGNKAHEHDCDVEVRQDGLSRAAEQIASDPEASEDGAVAEAVEMIDTFAAFCGSSFEVTITDELTPGLPKHERKTDYQTCQSAEDLKRDVAGLLERCERVRLNVIVRPRVTGLALRLIQLDDLDRAAVEKIQKLAFLVIETSGGNFQVWVAVGNAGSDIERRLKKGIGADPTASGATRLAGSINFKPKHAPNYPRVRLVQCNPGRRASAVELEQLGLLALKESETSKPAAHAPISLSRSSSGRHLAWPSYGLCVRTAPKARNHEGPDRSHADFEFCLISIDRGWSVEDTVQRLMLESAKAEQEGIRYARHTARRAALVVGSRGA